MKAYAAWNGSITDVRSVAVPILGIYPNPAIASFSLQAIEGRKNVEIYTLNGVLLILQLGVNNNTPIDISLLLYGQ